MPVERILGGADVVENLCKGGASYLIFGRRENIPQRRVGSLECGGALRLSPQCRVAEKARVRQLSSGGVKRRQRGPRTRDLVECRRRDRRRLIRKRKWDKCGMLPLALTSVRAPYGHKLPRGRVGEHFGAHNVTLEHLEEHSVRALVVNEQSGRTAMATSDPFLTRIADPGS